MKRVGEIALITAAIWTSVGVGGFYLLGGGWHGATYQAFQMTGGRYVVNRGAVFLLALGFAASLVAVVATLKSKPTEKNPSKPSGPPSGGTS